VELVSVREIRAPRGASAGPVLGLAIALVLFVGLLAYETQHLAMFARYPAWFGKPLFAHIYNPFAILWWIQRIDPTAFIVLPMQHFRPVNPGVHRLVLGILDHLKWGGGASLVVGFIAGLALDRPQRGSGLYGRAHFATARELAQSSLRKAQAGIVLGQTKRGELLIHGGTENVLVLGPPGVGKTDGTAVTTLRGGWQSSAIVFDPADELRARTIEARRLLGPVFVFDPRDPKTARINVLAGVRPDDVDAVRSIMSAFVADAADFAEIPEQAKFFLKRRDRARDGRCVAGPGTRRAEPRSSSALFLQSRLQERSAVRRDAARCVTRPLRPRDRCKIRQYGPALALEHRRDGDPAF